MHTLLALAIPEITKPATDHLYEIISAIVVALLTIFLIGPIKHWWQGVGKVAEARKAMYQDLAEILTEIQFCSVAISLASDKDIVPSTVNGLVESFYKRIKSHNYEHDLKTLRSLRSSMGPEVRGFENVMALMDSL